MCMCVEAMRRFAAIKGAECQQQQQAVPPPAAAAAATAARVGIAPSLGEA